MRKKRKFLFGCGGLASVTLCLLSCCSVGLLFTTFGPSTGQSADGPSIRRLARAHLPTLTPTLLPTKPPTATPVPAVPPEVSAPESPLNPVLLPTFTPVPALLPEASGQDPGLAPALLPVETPPGEALMPEDTEVLAIAEVPVETVPTETPTPVPVEEPTPTEAPTPVPVEEPTPTETPTPIPVPQITPQPMFSSCNCSGDKYDCDDFDSWGEAQGCFEYCQGAGAGDVHKLDENGNFLACENLLR